jgi:hypothetical protein
MAAAITGLFGLVLLLHGGASSSANTGVAAPGGATHSPTNTATPNPATAYVGTWHNTNSNTQTWVSIEINLQGDYIVAHFYGACSPTPCDDGSASARFSGSPVHLSLDPGFEVETFVLNVTGTTLQVTTFTHFTDHSGRSDYTAQDTFQQ